MVTTNTYVNARMMLGTSLADDDVACFANFAAKNLNT